MYQYMVILRIPFSSSLGIINKCTVNWIISELFEILLRNGCVLNFKKQLGLSRDSER